MANRNELEVYCKVCTPERACTASHQALIAWLRTEATAHTDEHERAKRNREAARARALAFDRKAHGIREAQKAPLPHSGPLSTMQAKLMQALADMADREGIKA